MIEKLKDIQDYASVDWDIIIENRKKINELVDAVNQLIKFERRASHVVNMHTPLGPGARNRDEDEAQLKANTERFTADLKEHLDKVKK